MRILLTRPIEQSEDLADLLTKKEIQVVTCPLMTIHEVAPEEINDRKYHAVIFTSSNSLRHSNLSALDKNIVIFTVGNKTAQKAQTFGFKNVISADGDLEKLSETIKNMLSPDEGTLLYMRGKHVAGRLADELGAAGFDVVEKIVYEAQARSALDDRVANLLLEGEIDYIPFYSQRSALIFKELVMRSKLENTLAQTSALCISANVAREIRSLRWKTILISDRPTQSDLFKLIAIDL